VGLLVLAAISVERKITWYLAVDQYGYLAFAHNLIKGRVFHHWEPIGALMPALPTRVDILFQTHIYDHGLVYCRYAPGFPILLAGWLTLFGDHGAHYLNPTIFIALLVLALAFQRRVLHSRWRATAGTALIVLFPTFLHLWALTLVRDLATHLFALLGLYLLLPARGRPLLSGRTAAAGAALGYAGSIRPDALLYLLPAVLVAIARWVHERAAWRTVVRGLAAGALALVVGLTPFFAYNWVATGNPFWPTQGMEVQGFLATSPPREEQPRVGYPPGAWRGGTNTSVQGGGLRLEHFSEVFPENVEMLRTSYGDLMLGLAVVGVVVALVQRRMLFLAVVPYVVAALIFYSFWSKSDPRYMSGVYVLLPMLMVEGVLGPLDLVRRLSWRRIDAARLVALGFTVAVLAGAALAPAPGRRSALQALTILVPLVAGLGALAAAAWPRRRIAALAAPAFALALVILAGNRVAAAGGARATFQRPAMERARATFNRAIEPDAIVITTEEVGRPAENIDYYSGKAKALYFTDLIRWRMQPQVAVQLFLRAGMVPYLLIPHAMEERDQLLEALQKVFTLELVADIPPAQAIDYFVAAAFHRGLRMELYRLGARASAP
jgi:4-amino-4-deoxy-L-arabinose transferase-like glycosyltransferase